MSIPNKTKSFLISLKVSGFTLIELLITIGILVIFIGIVATRSDLRTNRFIRQLAIDQITTDIDLVRSKAFARHDTLTIVFSANNNSYTFYIGPDTNREIMTDIPGSNNGIVSFSNSTLSNIDITNANFNNSTELQFLPQGTVKSGGTILIDDSVTITVANLTGRWSVN